MHLIFRRQILLEELPRPRPSSSLPTGNQGKQSKPSGIIFALGGTLKDKLPPKSAPNPKINLENRLQKLPSPSSQLGPKPSQPAPDVHAVEPVVKAPAEREVVKQQPTVHESESNAVHEPEFPTESDEDSTKAATELDNFTATLSTVTNIPIQEELPAAIVDINRTDGQKNQQNSNPSSILAIILPVFALIAIVALGFAYYRMRKTNKNAPIVASGLDTHSSDQETWRNGFNE